MEEAWDGVGQDQYRHSGCAWSSPKNIKLKESSVYISAAFLVSSLLGVVRL